MRGEQSNVARVAGLCVSTNASQSPFFASTWQGTTVYELKGFYRLHLWELHHICKRVFARNGTANKHSEIHTQIYAEMHNCMLSPLARGILIFLWVSWCQLMQAVLIVRLHDMFLQKWWMLGWMDRFRGGGGWLEQIYCTKSLCRTFHYVGAHNLGVINIWFAKAAAINAISEWACLLRMSWRVKGTFSSAGFDFL